jgi:hypothetical protein
MWVLCLILVNLLNSIGTGANVYEDGKKKLESAIREYDQAILDLAASVVAGMAYVQSLLIITRFDISAGTK